MSYNIMCSSCQKKTWAANIVDLIDKHTDSAFGEDGGMLVCGHCSALGHIYRSSKLQERGKTYVRYIKGVFRIPSNEERTYFPYLFLNSDTEDGDIGHVHFNYYKDTRKDGGRLKHGHGPGGAPVFGPETLVDMIEKLLQCGLLTANDLERAAKIGE